jgi:hypothetical protein
MLVAQQACLAAVTGKKSPQTAEHSSLLAAAYAYIPDISGSASLGPVSAPLALTGGELLGGAKAGFMAYTRYNAGTHFVYGEAISMRFKKRSFEPFFGLAVDSRLNFLEAGVGRDFWLADARARVSPYVGTRFLDIELAVNGAALNQQAVERGVDLAFGVSVESRVNSRWGAAFKIDHAGFGLSRRRYRSATALVVRSVSVHCGVFGGWRFASFDSTSSPSGLALSIAGNGPQFGILYRR